MSCNCVAIDKFSDSLNAVLDLSWAHAELAPFYPKIGRPSIDPGAHDPDLDL
jgi:hypothetical protein